MQTLGYRNYVKPKSISVISIKLPDFTINYLGMRVMSLFRKIIVFNNLDTGNVYRQLYIFNFSYIINIKKKIKDKHIYIKYKNKYI